ncbi:MAG: hypothetical protein R3B69_00940 [Candidatus Paceibacterota bacterium]
MVVIESICLNKILNLIFGDSRKPQHAFVVHEGIITDRGSRYSVSYGKVTERRDDIKFFLKELKRNKKYAKATHNTWAARVSHDGAIFETKNDDGRRARVWSSCV